MANWAAFGGGLLQGTGKGLESVAKSMIETEKEKVRALKEESMALARQEFDKSMQTDRISADDKRLDKSIGVEDRRRKEDQTIHKSEKESDALALAKRTEDSALAAMSVEQRKSFREDESVLIDLKKEQAKIEVLQEKNSNDLGQFEDPATMETGSAGLSFDERRQKAIDKIQSMIDEQQNKIYSRYPELSGYKASQDAHTAAVKKPSNINKITPADYDKTNEMHIAAAAEKVLSVPKEEQKQRLEELSRINPEFAARVKEEVQGKVGRLNTQASSWLSGSTEKDRLQSKGMLKP